MSLSVAVYALVTLVYNGADPRVGCDRMGDKRIFADPEAGEAKGVGRI